MLSQRVILFTVVVIYVIFDACQSQTNVVKHKTASRLFTKIRANETRMCRYINNDFEKLLGAWYFVLQTVVSRTTPLKQCGRLFVSKTMMNGFEAQLRYQTPEKKYVEIPLTGTFVNESMVEIPEMRQLIAGNPKWEYPFTAQIGICDDDSIFFIEPVHYFGGGMTFTKEIPQSLSAMKMRFGTFDELSGKERTVSVPMKCGEKECENVSNITICEELIAEFLLFVSKCLKYI